MPWTTAQFIDIDATASPSFFSNNFASDGYKSFAFACGTKVQCTRRGLTASGRCDFTLAYSEDLDVTGVYWWHGIVKFNRPLLVITTDSSTQSPATLQVWNTCRGTGTRLFRFKLEDVEQRFGMKLAGSEAQLEFARGISQASSSTYGQMLFCGSSTGAVYGIVYRESEHGSFCHSLTLRDLKKPISAVGGDKEQSDLLAASDEDGNLVVWRVEEELDGDSSYLEDYSHLVVYRHSNAQDFDFQTSIGIRGNIVITGHASGRVSFHDVERGLLVASATTNTKAITAIDTYYNRDLVLVCGEDCRVSVLGFPSSRGRKPVVHFSVTLHTALTGCAFTTTKSRFPSIAMLTWGQAKIVQFEYQRSADIPQRYSEQRAVHTLRPFAPPANSHVDSAISPLSPNHFFSRFANDSEPHCLHLRKGGYPQSESLERSTSRDSFFQTSLASPVHPASQHRDFFG